MESFKLDEVVVVLAVPAVIIEEIEIEGGTQFEKGMKLMQKNDEFRGKLARVVSPVPEDPLGEYTIQMLDSSVQVKILRCFLGKRPSRH